MMITVLINLVDNALKYSPEDRPVRIVAREEQDSLVIEVRDQGMGIPESELGKVGRRFFRASNTKPVMGTGLGIYSARRFLAYHGATLNLESNRGRGTTATVRVPLPMIGGVEALHENVAT